MPRNTESHMPKSVVGENQFASMKEEFETVNTSLFPFHNPVLRLKCTASVFILEQYGFFTFDPRSGA